MSFLPTKPPSDVTHLDVKAMLTGDVNRLRYVTRYSTSLVVHRENVAEHSYYVSLYAMFICRWVRENYFSETMDVFDELKVLHRCLMHDMDESRTGDFQRPFKYRRPQMKALMDEAAKEEFQECVSQVFPKDSGFLSYATHQWENAKEDNVIGCIVAFADYLSVISHLNAEVACANLSVMQHYESLCEYSHKFDDPKFDFLRPLINQTREVFCDMIKVAGLNVNLDEFNGAI